MSIASSTFLGLALPSNVVLDAHIPISPPPPSRRGFIVLDDETISSDVSAATAELSSLSPTSTTTVKVRAANTCANPCFFTQRLSPMCEGDYCRVGRWFLVGAEGGASPQTVATCTCETNPAAVAALVGGCVGLTLVLLTLSYVTYRLVFRYRRWRFIKEATEGHDVPVGYETNGDGVVVGVALTAREVFSTMLSGGTVGLVAGGERVVQNEPVETEATETVDSRHRLRVGDREQNTSSAHRADLTHEPAFHDVAVTDDSNEPSSEEAERTVRSSVDAATIAVAMTEREPDEIQLSEGTEAASRTQSQSTSSSQTHLWVSSSTGASALGTRPASATTSSRHSSSRRASDAEHHPEQSDAEAVDEAPNGSINKIGPQFDSFRETFCPSFCSPGAAYLPPPSARAYCGN